ncbi:MAG: anaerobic ribonucleoside-triphosphate reductase activating protein [Thermotogota bacterium]
MLYNKTIFAGFRSFSFVDFPGKLSSVLYTGGCNFKCPWCHNWKIALAEKYNFLTEKDLYQSLEKAFKKIDALTITGGEPTIHNDLTDYIKRIKKEFKVAIKLDTNGSNPKKISEIIQEGNIDYIAMDIKSSPENYKNLTGLNKSYWESVFETLGMLRNSKIDYELRMTYVNGLSKNSDLRFFEDIALKDEKIFITNANSTNIYTVKEKEIFKSDKLTVR